MDASADASLSTLRNVVVPRAAHHARVCANSRNWIVDLRRRLEPVRDRRERDRVAGTEKSVPERDKKARLDFLNAALRAPEELTAIDPRLHLVQVGIVLPARPQYDEDAMNFNFGQHCSGLRRVGRLGFEYHAPSGVTEYDGRTGPANELRVTHTL